jgi:hypothetical protein
MIVSTHYIYINNMRPDQEVLWMVTFVSLLVEHKQSLYWSNHKLRVTSKYESTDWTKELSRKCILSCVISLWLTSPNWVIIPLQVVPIVLWFYVWVISDCLRPPIEAF